MFILYNATDYYFSEDSSGRRRYYDRYTGKRIRERYIPEDIIDDIPDESVDIENDVDVLLKMKASYEEQIEILREELKEIEEKLDLPEEKPQKKSSQSKKLPSFPVDLFETFVRIYGETFFANINFFQEAFIPPQKRREETPPKKDILDSYNITNRKEWFRWLRSNHPDKGGDTEICKSVLLAGRARGW